MSFEESHWKDAREILARVPDTLVALLGDLPDGWVRSDEGPDTFSSFDVVAHLADLESTDWVSRIRVILEGGEKPFEPVDRFAFREWSEGLPLEDVLAVFGERRQENLRTVDSLLGEAPDFSRPGLHPALGPVDLGQLISAWVVHDLTHVAQIARVLSKRYRTAVGPWADYLTVLHDRENPGS
ncbi:MAG: DinB family protein [Gemmatimonadetes bacterium]|nr:DinB family protein [Gemmatimonadota bacterium]NNM35470.1 DinB family protein [Gemmatimonadota bacterium]